MREGFVFYTSFYEAIMDLSLQQQAKMYNAICRYALYGEEPNLTGTLSTIFKLIRPQIDANNRRYENGRKGGRPAKSTDSGDVKNEEKTEPKPKQNQSKTKVKPNETEPKPKEKEKEKDKDNDKEKGLGSVVVVPNQQVTDPLSLWHRLTANDIDSIYEVYPDSGGFLIEAVNKEVLSKRRDVTDPVAYVLGYASRVKWDDGADHFTEAAI